MIGRLPVTLDVGGAPHKIRTDYRDILVIIQAFNDAELSNEEKYEVMLTILYEDDSLTTDDIPEAVEKGLWFLDCGQKQENHRPQIKVMDWEQDEAILFPAINKVAGHEVRTDIYMHWWTFVGYFMEIDDGTFSTVLGIRQKKAKGKKLESWEKEFYASNKSMVDLKRKYSEEEQKEIDYYNQLLQ